MTAHYRLSSPIATGGITVARSLWVTLCVMAFTLPAAAGALTGRAIADDGDSLTMGGRRIRLFGVDAFEYGQTCGRMKCGRAAFQHLQHLVKGRSVSCVRQDIDSYGRVVAICRLADGRDLGREMVRNGYAVAYRRYSTRYVTDEMAAKKARAGAWAHGFRLPSVYRASR
jgi:endonuclease YncB( thermonuclease family)